MADRRPGGALSTRPLHFIWLCDCSGSMAVDGKIQSLNNAIQQALPLMRKAAEDNPNAQVLVRALRFSDGAQWHVSQPTPVEQFHWTDLHADGVTDMGKALSMVAEQMQIPPMSDRALPPVLVMITDGQPTDDFNRGLRELMAQPWGKKAVRIAIAVGQQADYEILQKFIGNIELKPLSANNPDALVNRIKWVSTAVLKAASAPASQAQRLDDGQRDSASNVPIPAVPPEKTAIDPVNDVW
ncbi:MAG: VWA domain-containing protein [Pegethrix bostrychoides GSE-TBD4-15B]|uniref:VWA domain-containing protein n=1 Tax=Pegethrix bostrychoides GSE-TBD4-15B TaxID=2839662 RepID=A0A951U3L0_9CYAN|nr:VWA domain-containing protein [Pegethrix bostrychoides GSE-TBD4-15B]